MYPTLAVANFHRHQRHLPSLVSLFYFYCSSCPPAGCLSFTFQRTPSSFLPFNSSGSSSSNSAEWILCVWNLILSCFGFSLRNSRCQLDVVSAVFPIALVMMIENCKILSSPEFLQSLCRSGIQHGSSKYLSTLKTAHLASKSTIPCMRMSFVFPGRPTDHQTDRPSLRCCFKAYFCP